MEERTAPRRPDARAQEIVARLAALPSHDAASLRRLRRAVSTDHSEASAREVLELAEELLRSGAPGSHVIACELILHHGTAAGALRAADLRRLGGFMRSWGDVDVFACYVAGRAWRSGQVRDAEIARWARSENRWWRRAALVSTVPLNVRAQGGSGDAPRTLAICEMLVTDRDDMVVKGLSWALRALAVRDPSAVAAFLRRHEQSLAPRVLREVRNKLDTGRKGGAP